MAEQLPIDFEAARRARDEGMSAALDRANAQCFDWSKQAFDYLLAFAQAHAEFISEDVSDAANADPAFPSPATDRAWGSIYTRAQREGIIARAPEAGRSRRRHASICPKWVSKVYQRVAA